MHRGQNFFNWSKLLVNKVPLEALNFSLECLHLLLRYYRPFSITRSNSMFSTFCIGLAAITSGLCDIDRLLFKVIKSCVWKLGSPCTTKMYREFLVILNNALSISHSPLAAGPIRNAENTESLLSITRSLYRFSRLSGMNQQPQSH